DGVCNYIDIKNIFVMDGHSTDNTRNIAQKKGVNIDLDLKKGKGCGIQIAIKRIQRDILVLMDSDGSHRPEEFRNFLEVFYRDKEVSMVIGSRIKGGSEELHKGFTQIIRLSGNLISAFIVNLVWRSKLTDIQNGFRAVRRTMFQDISLTENSFAIEQEMVMKCLKKKIKIVEIPSWELKRKYNSSHITVSKMLPKYIKSFIKNIFYE
ncbi:MAG: glycosyltransferase family 2 protein, partial [Candidatus Omnitrophica bacterium]|nr:glycosyltransferase family 2 protein [Candidatus Omnitrophota bacterium]